MKAPLHDFERQYASALQEHLANPSEAFLHRAYELGRKALDGGLGVLEMAVLYHKAIVKLLPVPRTPEASARLLKGTESFFVESLAPFEMTHRAAHDANTALRQLNETLEQEAKRIAHSIHEETGQFLACTYLALDEIRRDLPPPFRGRLQAVRDLLEQIAGHLRQLSHELRPTILDDYGLLPALEFLAEGISKRSRLEISVKGSNNGRLPSSVETGLYRIVQEALTNASKHARANRVDVRVQQKGRMIRCSIIDDGVGFNVSAVKAGRKHRGLGLVGIRQRIDVLGGTLQIDSKRGRGTQMHISIPLEN
ncbi:MAG TPA: ATP-binding protein [Candidatus Udaeobacter sp.]|jgi:signal transduction histidine kinase|nr:ATP-binding protein [Candidatus Udaeobacter sp.]